MSDWAEEFEQPSQWEATEGEVAAQETAIEEGAPAEGEPGFQENPLDLPENQVSMESAEAVSDSLPEPRGGKTTARVEGGEIFEKQWADSPGFEGKPATTEQVLSEGVEAGVEHDPHVFDPKNVEGGYESSHAERQAAVNYPDEPIGVSRDMCAGCQRWFQARAMSRGVPQFVADPSGGRVFMPDGRIIRARRRGADHRRRRARATIIPRKTTIARTPRIGGAVSVSQLGPSSPPALASASAPTTANVTNAIPYCSHVGSV